MGGVIMNTSYKGEGCRQPIVLTRTIRGMSTPLGMSTTTTLGTRMRLPRLCKTSETKPCVLSASVRDVISQGTFALPQIEENNLSLHTQESPNEIAKAKEGRFYDELFESMLKRKAGVMWKPQIKSYVNNGSVSAFKLANQIINKKYRSSTPQSIMIYYPKKREVKAIPFRDRVFQGYLNDKYIYPKMTRSFIYSNMASQTNKGTDKARDLFKHYLWNYYTHHKNEGYVLQIDISKYYQSIPKDKAYELFASKLPKNLLSHVKEILDTQFTTSFFAGSQLIQILGIAYLDKLDHFIKEKLHIRYYIRYQDDFLLIHDCRQTLEQALTGIEKQLIELSLRLNHKKTHIKKLTCSIEFLGFIFTLQSDGKVYMRINPSKVKTIRKRLKKQPWCLQNYKHFILKGNSFKLYSRLEKEIQDGNNLKRVS